MFNNSQIVNTEDIAKAINNLVGALASKDQLKKVKVTDSKGKVHYLCPGLITKIEPSKFYNPERVATKGRYINGDSFDIDLLPEELGKQLGLPD